MAVDDLRHDNGESSDYEGGSVFVNLVVPPGAEAGVDFLSFEYGNAELEVLIPAGSSPGDVLRIHVGIGGGAACNDNDIASEGDENGEDVSTRSSSGLMDELGGMNLPTTRNATMGSVDPSSELGGIENEDDDTISSRQKDETARSKIGRANAHTTTVILGDGLIRGNATAETQPKSLHILESIDETATVQSIDGEGDGTHGMVWASGKILAQALTSSFGLRFLSTFLRANDGETCHLNCLELGSGSGVCGLALAHALSLCCRPDSTTTNCKDASATILLTDRGKYTVDLLRKNIQQNLPPSMGSSDPKDQCISIAAESLVWGDTLKSKTRFRLIIGSDLLYNTQESYDPLVNTIRHHLCHERGIVLLAVRWRKPDLERAFFRRAERDGLTFELWGEFADDDRFGGRRTPCKLNWREYGDPESDSSNGFFRVRKISVAGTKMNLGWVTERDMESMNDEEYSIFDELQVQVYVGKYSKEETITPVT
jgi:hypothetical protein